MTSKLNPNWVADCGEMIPVSWAALTRMLPLIGLMLVIEGARVAVADRAMHYLILVAMTLLYVPLTFGVFRAVAQKFSAWPSDQPVNLGGKKFINLAIMQVILTLAVTPFELPVIAVQKMMTDFKPEHLQAQISSAVGFLILLTPLTWWLVKSSLAYVLICVRNESIVMSLIKSHQLLNGHFWLALRYLAIPLILLVVPLSALSEWAYLWIASVNGNPNHQVSDLTMGYEIYLVTELIDLTIGLIVFEPLFMRLYLHVREHFQETPKLLQE